MRLLALLLAAALAAAACASDEPSETSETSGETETDEGAETGEGTETLSGRATAIVANSPGTLTTNGDQRVLVALVGEGNNEFLGSAEVGATIEFVSPDGSSTNLVPGQWLKTLDAPLGLYVAHYAFAETGRWEVRVTGTGADVSTTAVDVFDDSVVPEPGDPAPRSETPTATAGEDLTPITTDPDPDPAFYELTIAEAVTNGRPTVVVFATPAFCTTALCGPTLEIVKEAVAGRDDIDVVHVEPFDLDEARSGSLVAIPTMREWNLATEPWVFVVDGEGDISSSYEGILGPDEIQAAVADL